MSWIDNWINSSVGNQYEYRGTTENDVNVAESNFLRTIGSGLIGASLAGNWQKAAPFLSMAIPKGAEAYRNSMLESEKRAEVLDDDKWEDFQRELFMRDDERKQRDYQIEDTDRAAKLAVSEDLYGSLNSIIDQLDPNDPLRETARQTATLYKQLGQPDGMVKMINDLTPRTEAGRDLATKLDLEERARKEGGYEIFDTKTGEAIGVDVQRFSADEARKTKEAFDAAQRDARRTETLIAATNAGMPNQDLINRIAAGEKVVLPDGRVGIYNPATRDVDFIQPKQTAEEKVAIRIALNNWEDLFKENSNGMSEAGQYMQSLAEAQFMAGQKMSDEAKIAFARDQMTKSIAIRMKLGGMLGVPGASIKQDEIPMILEQLRNPEEVGELSVRPGAGLELLNAIRSAPRPMTNPVGNPLVAPKLPGTPISPPGTMEFENEVRIKVDQALGIAKSQGRTVDRSALEAELRTALIQQYQADKGR